MDKEKKDCIDANLSEGHKCSNFNSRVRMGMYKQLINDVMETIMYNGWNPRLERYSWYKNHELKAVNDSRKFANCLVRAYL